MSLDILDHPVVERLIMGDKVRVQDLRDALVEFWEKNDTFSLCGNCPVSAASAVGCCGTCQYHDVTKGCTLRNVACLSHTCPSLLNKLKREGVADSFIWFNGMIHGPMFAQEPFFNRKRLPDDTLLELQINEDSHWRPLEIVIVDGVKGVKQWDYDDESNIWPRRTLEDKLGKAGIKCRVSRDLHARIMKKYPDSPVYIDDEYVTAFLDEQQASDPTLTRYARTR
jgi:hypothetical protein